MVTPRMVKSPVTLYSLSETFSTFVLLKVISGNFSTKKKSSLRRCLSRFSLAVSIDVAWILKSTDAAARLASSLTIVAAKSPNEPRTCDIMWRTVKPTWECALSVV